MEFSAATLEGCLQHLQITATICRQEVQCLGEGGGVLYQPSYTLTTCFVRHYISLRAMQCRDSAAYSWAFVLSPSGIAGKRREICGFSGANLCSSRCLFITLKHIVTIQSSLERWQARQSSGDKENETKTMEGAHAGKKQRGRNGEGKSGESVMDGRGSNYGRLD